MPVEYKTVALLAFSATFYAPLPPWQYLSPSQDSDTSYSPISTPSKASTHPVVPSSGAASASAMKLPLRSEVSHPMVFSVFVISLIF